MFFWKQETRHKTQDTRDKRHEGIVIQSEAKNLPARQAGFPKRVRDKLTLKRYTIPFLNAQSNSEAQPKNPTVTLSLSKGVLYGDRKQETGNKRQDTRITNHDGIVILSIAKNL